MGENSKIEWCDHSWNPWLGCTRVSLGCVNCYAESFARRYGKAEWGPSAQRVRTSPANWRKPLAWNRKAEQEGRRYKVFCASLADVFEDNEQVAEWRYELFNMILATKHLDWLLLTKRPDNWYNSGDLMLAADKLTPGRFIRLASKGVAGRLLDGREWNEMPGETC